jgi:hypothetical protein
VNGAAAPRKCALTEHRPPAGFSKGAAAPWGLNGARSPGPGRCRANDERIPVGSTRRDPLVGSGIDSATQPITNCKPSPPRKNGRARASGPAAWGFANNTVPARPEAKPYRRCRAILRSNWSARRSGSKLEVWSVVPVAVGGGFRVLPECIRPAIAHFYFHDRGGKGVRLG